jgi:hypothetical protein
VTLVQIDKWTLAEELWSFGEDSLCREPLRMDDEEMIRVWVLAGRLSLHEKARSSGEAAALAAIEVIEGRRRRLAYATPTTSRPSQLPPNARRAVCGDQPGRGERELPADVAMTPLGDDPERWPLADGPRSPGRKGRGNPCARCARSTFGRSERVRTRTRRKARICSDNRTLSERTRTSAQYRQAGVTGSSPVPPIFWKPLLTRGFRFSAGFGA